MNICRACPKVDKYLGVACPMMFESDGWEGMPIILGDRVFLEPRIGGPPPQMQKSEANYCEEYAVKDMFYLSSQPSASPCWPQCTPQRQDLPYLVATENNGGVYGFATNLRQLPILALQLAQQGSRARTN